MLPLGLLAALAYNGPITPFSKGTVTVGAVGGEAALTPLRLHGLVHGFTF